MNVYLKVWRYRGGKLTYRSSTNPSEDLDLAALKLPEAKKAALKENDWIIHRLPASARGKKTAEIQPEQVAAVIPDAKVPRWAELWHYDGDDVRRIYRRRSSSQGTETAQARAEVTALCEGDEELILLYSGKDTLSYVYTVQSERMEPVTLEDLQLCLAPGQQAQGTLFDEDDVLLVTLLKRLNKVRDKIAYLDAKKAEKSPGLFRIAREAAEEVLSGAEPAPIQGHNVAHGIPGLAENLDKVISVCTGRQTLAEVNDVNGQSFESGWGGQSGQNAASFGQGVSLVDGAWQAVGTLVALVRSFIDLKDIHGVEGDGRDAEFGANPYKRKMVDIGTHTAKLVATSANIAAAIEKVATAATAASTAAGTIIPVVGIITGLVATVRSTHQASKSHRRARRLRSVLESKGGELPKDVGDLIGYGMAKASRKRNVKALEATTAALGTVSATVLLVGAIVAGANAWNPVGWGIGAVVVLAGTGLLIYKLVRRKTSDKRARKRGFTRAAYPEMLVRRFLKAFAEGPGSIITEALAAVLEAYGCDPLSLVMGGNEQVEFACTRIARHLKG